MNSGFIEKTVKSIFDVNDVSTIDDGDICRAVIHAIDKPINNTKLYLYVTMAKKRGEKRYFRFNSKSKDSVKLFFDCLAKTKLNATEEARGNYALEKHNSNEAATNDVKLLRKAFDEYNKQMSTNEDVVEHLAKVANPKKRGRPTLSEEERVKRSAERQAKTAVKTKKVKATKKVSSKKEPKLTAALPDIDDILSEGAEMSTDILDIPVDDFDYLYADPN
jgi:hypothetical protein